MSKNKHISRKRLKKLLMGAWYSRNDANFWASLAKSMNLSCEHYRKKRKRGVCKDA